VKIDRTSVDVHGSLKGGQAASTARSTDADLATTVVLEDATARTVSKRVVVRVDLKFDLGPDFTSRAAVSTRNLAARSR